MILTDELERKLCVELCDLLLDESCDLSQEVLSLVITRTVGRTPEELLADETVKNKLKTILPDGSQHCITYHTSIYALYGLIQLYSGKEPKFGWGNPVKGSDTGIGDDVERLYRIFRIREEISNPVSISVDNYTRLFDILLPTLTRLDSDGAFKDRHKVLADKLKAISNSTWMQSVYKRFTALLNSNRE